MRHYNHVIRFAIILTAVLIGFFAVRGFIVPESFGVYGTYMYGYHRGNSDSEEAAQPILYYGSDKCRKCHEKLYEQESQAGHSKIACESCHANWQAHNNNTRNKVLKNGSIEACMQCHKKLSARPAAFPQITDIKQHMDDQEQEFEKGMECLDCHDPHEPL